MVGKLQSMLVQGCGRKQRALCVAMTYSTSKYPTRDTPLGKSHLEQIVHVSRDHEHGVPARALTYENNILPSAPSNQ